MASEVFKKYYKKIGRESILKSLLYGLTIGFSLAFVCIAAGWLAGFKAGIYIGLGAFVLSVAVASPLFYHLKFRPTTKKIAQRIDALGLEERMLTMAELENDNSFMAMKQREDAMKAMKSVSCEMLKIAVSVPLIAAVAVSATLGTGMTVAAAVAPDGGKQLIEPLKEKKTFDIVYEVEGKGWVIDFAKHENAALIDAAAKREEKRKIDLLNKKEVVEDVALPEVFLNRLNVVLSMATNEEARATMVLDGANAEAISYSVKVTQGDGFGVTLMALPQKGYVFVGWSDGVKSPYRVENEFTENKTVTALFDVVETVEEGKSASKDGKEDGEGEDGEESEGDSDPEAKDNNGGKPGSGGSGSSDGEWIDGAKGSAANQIINGKTYYGDVFDEAYREMLERMANDSSMTEAEKKAISDYLDSIRKN